MLAALLNIGRTNPLVNLYPLDYCFVVLHAMLHGKGSSQGSWL